MTCGGSELVGDQGNIIQIYFGVANRAFVFVKDQVR
jgi:hypothetical protein